MTTHIKPFSLSHRVIKIALLVMLLFAIQWLESTHYHHLERDHTCSICQLSSDSVTFNDGPIQALGATWQLLWLVTPIKPFVLLLSTYFSSYASRAPPQ